MTNQSQQSNDSPAGQLSTTSAVALADHPLGNSFSADNLVRAGVISQFLQPYARYANHKNLVLELRYIHHTKVNPRTGNPHAFPSYLTIEEFQDPKRQVKIVHHALRGYNTFIGVQPRYCKLRRSSGKNRDIPAVYCLYMDADEWTADNLSANLAKYGLPKPTVLVSSGRGLHLRWFLKTPVTAAFGERVQQYLIKTVMSGTRIADERAFDLARILRLPDTLNWKDPQKPIRTELLEVNDFYYDWSEVLGGRVPHWADDPELQKAWVPPASDTSLDERPSSPLTIRSVQKRSRVPNANAFAISASPVAKSRAVPRFGKVLRISNANAFAMYLDDFRLSQGGTRHATLLVMARAIVNRLGTELSNAQLDAIHDRWFIANRQFISSSADHSRLDLRRMYDSLLKTYDPSKRSFSLNGIVQHPRLDTIPADRTIHRQVANVLHTGWLQYGTKFFLSYAAIAELIGISKETVKKVLDVLRTSGHVLMLEKGAHTTRTASRWSTDISLSSEAVPVAIRSPKPHGKIGSAREGMPGGKPEPWQADLERYMERKEAAVWDETDYQKARADAAEYVKRREVANGNRVRERRKHASGLQPRPCSTVKGRRAGKAAKKGRSKGHVPRRKQVKKVRARHRR